MGIIALFILLKVLYEPKSFTKSYSYHYGCENMKRPTEEVGLLFKLFLTVLKNETKKLKENNVKLKIIGDLSVFTPEIQLLATAAEDQLQDNDGLTLVIAAN